MKRQKKIGKTVTQRNIRFWAEQFAQQKMFWHEKKPWGKIEMSNIWNEISGLTVVKEITPEPRQEINGTGGFFVRFGWATCGSLLDWEHGDKNDTQQWSSHILPSASKWAHQNSKTLGKSYSTPANLCDVISSTQPYFHICRDTNLSGGVGGGCVVDCCVPYMENLFDFSGTDGTGVHIIIVNTCQKIYLNSVVGIFSTCLCYAWTWFFSFITRRQRVTSGNRMEMLYIGSGSVQLDCFDRPNILVIKSILAFDGTLTKQNAQSKRQMPIEWIKFGMPFSMPKYVDNENWKISNDGHCRWIYLAYVIVSTLFYEICAVNWNDVFFPAVDCYHK